MQANSEKSVWKSVKKYENKSSKRKNEAVALRLHCAKGFEFRGAKD